MKRVLGKDFSPKVETYKPEIKKLTKANSHISDGVVFYIVKKDWNGKPSPFYMAYEYESRKLVWFAKDKESLVKILNNRIDDIKELLHES